MSSIQVMSASGCPYAQRARMALAEKGIPFEVVEIDLKNKPDWFLKLNPLGKVPVVVHNAGIVYESAIILEYLEDAFPEAKPLLPKDPMAKAHVRILVNYLNSTFGPAIGGIMFAKDDETLQKNVEAAQQCLAHFEKQLEEKGPYLAGSEITMIDIALMPHIERLPILERIKGFSIPLEKFPKFTAWKGLMESTKGFQATKNDPEALRVQYERFLAPKA